ncbi:MAG: hypothetical protein ACOC2U_00290 [bacterium]
MKASEKYIQPGCKVKIRREPKTARITGFKKDTEHVIQKPPKNKINGHMGVWVKDKRNKLRFLHFQYYVNIAKNSKGIKRKIKRKKKIVRRRK